MAKMLIDVGSTYFKISADDEILHFFRDFNKDIYDDLSFKCSNKISKFDKKDIFICSSANGGLSTLIIGATSSFSLKFANNIAYNSGINIISSVLYQNLDTYPIPSDTIDVVIIVGGIDGVDIFDNKLFDYLEKLKYHNIIFVGSKTQSGFLEKNIKNLTILDNIISNKLQIKENQLKHYLSDLYAKDIVCKQDIKNLYKITSNQIYPTPYIVNKSLPFIHTKLEVTDPFIVIDIGGATTDIHYSKDLIANNILNSNGYDRLVFKKLGVYKSRQSLVFSAKNNEFVYELLAYLNTTENMLDIEDESSIKLLMQLSIFLVLYKVSKQHLKYINLKLENLNSIILTGGITKVLSDKEVETIVSFFYKKILNFKTSPKVVIDKNYLIWTLGIG
jgi:hypothetical protein